MKFSSFIALLALPVALAGSLKNRREPERHALAARQLEARTLFASGTCDMRQLANCYIQGKNCNSRCECSAPSSYQKPTPLYGSWSSCTDISSITACWRNGQGCDSWGRCTGSPKPATGTCTDWFRVAVCSLEGKKTDGNCNCVSATSPGGSVTIPGGSTPCGDPARAATCWKQGWGCNAKCVCVTPTTSTKPSTPTPTAPTSDRCYDWRKIAECSCKGLKADNNCNCVSGTPVVPGGPSDCKDPAKLSTCWKEGWGCNAKCMCYAPTTSVTPPTSTAPPVQTSAAGTCNDWFAIAQCHLRKMKTDGRCNCVPGTPTIPGGSSDCTDPNKLANCWKQGWGCNARCVCQTPATSTTTPAPTSTPPTAPGTCWDWFKVAQCATRGLKADGNCNCTPGTPTVPGGNKDCTDPNKLATCWKQGWGCNAKCVCVTPTATPTTTKTPPTTTPTAVGQCTNALLIKFCWLSGRGVNADCTCMERCDCTTQWQCHLKGGKLDGTCKCVLPSGAPKRRSTTDADFQALCPTGLTACHVDSLSADFDGRHECIDTSSNIDSCGGCVAEGRGQDCGAIDGAADVACVRGGCVVSRCAAGWQLTPNGTACLPELNAARLQQKVWGLF